MGGGGDGGYAARQAEQERQRQQARDALNLYFGVAPTSGPPTREQFQQAPAAGIGGGDVRDRQWTAPSAPVDDAAAFEAALKEYNAQQEKAKANQAALDSLYAGVRQNAYTAGKRRADEQRSNAARDLKFELFARGLQGGSVDIDQNALLGRVYGQGLTDLGAKADATATQLRSNDEQTRVGLLQSIDNGMDQGSAISSALNQMRNNSDRAAAEATGTSLGDLFADAGLLYQQGRRARGEQTALDYARTSGLRSPSRAPTSVTRGTTTFAG